MSKDDKIEGFIKNVLCQVEGNFFNRFIVFNPTIKMFFLTQIGFPRMNWRRFQ